MTSIKDIKTLLPFALEGLNMVGIFLKNKSTDKGLAEVLEAQATMDKKMSEQIDLINRQITKLKQLLTASLLVSLIALIAVTISFFN